MFFFTPSKYLDLGIKTGLHFFFGFPLYSFNSFLFSVHFYNNLILLSRQRYSCWWVSGKVFWSTTTMYYYFNPLCIFCFPSWWIFWFLILLFHRNWLLFICTQKPFEWVFLFMFLFVLLYCDFQFVGIHLRHSMLIIRSSVSSWLFLLTPILYK